jgi:hypothetical protein
VIQDVLPGVLAGLGKRLLVDAAAPAVSTAPTVRLTIPASIRELAWKAPKFSGGPRPRHRAVRRDASPPRQGFETFFVTPVTL